MKIIRNINKLLKKLCEFDKKIVLSDKLTKCIIGILFIWFLYQSLFFVTNLKGFIPDQSYHLRYINIYKNKEDLSPIIHEWKGDAYPQDTRTPSYFYHYLLGNFLKIFHSDYADYNILRTVNFYFNILTVLVFIKLTNKLTKNNWIKILSMIFMTNTLMFTVLGAGINYDNLANLLSIISIYFVIKIFKDKEYKYFYFLLSEGLLTCLVKVAFVPLLIIELLVCALNLKPIYKFTTSVIKNYKKLINFKSLVFIIISIIIFSLFIERYGYNLIKYKSISPSCDKLYSFEKCMTEPQFARDQNLIKTSSTREGLDFIIFTTKWYLKMLEGMFGLNGHRLFAYNTHLTYLITAELLLFLFSLIRYSNIKKEKLIWLTIFLAGGYIFTVFFYVNYRQFRSIRLFGLAMQGRYLFPVLSLMFYIFAYYSIRLLKYSNILKIFLITITLISLLYWGFFWYLRTAGPEWYINNQPYYLLIK